MPPAVLVLFIVLILLIIRRIGKFNIPMWFSMALGALSVLTLGQITPMQAVQVIEWQIILFLFGMFIVGAAAESSGLLKQYAFSYLTRFRSTRQFLFVFIFFIGFLTAFLMNDTVAVIFVPFALWCAAHYKIPAKTMLFTLAASVTTGSALSPIGAPPNLLIAVEGLNGSFLPFLIYLAIPALISLGLVYVWISFSLRSSSSDKRKMTATSQINSKTRTSSDLPADDSSRHLRFLTVFSLILVFLAVFVYIGASVSSYHFPIAAIAFAGALPLLVFSKKRFEFIQKIDWPTLLFFISMFVLIESVSMTGFFQNFFPENFASSVPILYSMSIIVSQFLSNVPFVSLVLPLLESQSASVLGYMTLAAGNTIAGNLTIFGAASNIIIIQQAEKSGETLTFFEFLKFGLPLVLMQSAVFIGWLMLMSSVFPVG